MEMERKQTNILLLCPTKWDQKVSSFIRYLPEETKQSHKVKILHPRSTKDDLLQFTKQCEDIINTQNISMVLSFSDIACLVHAALSETFPHIRGPTVESVYLTCHKFLSRKYLDPDSATVPSMVLDRSDIEDGGKMRDVADFIRGKGGFLKPIVGAIGEGTLKINTVDQLYDLLKDDSCTYGTLNGYYQSFMNHWIKDKGLMYDINLDTVILEEFVDGKRQVSVDGCVLDGIIYHWSIIEDTHWKEYPQCFQGGILPTALTDNQERVLYQNFDEIVTKMIKTGFDNQFVHVQYFLTEDDQVKVVEVNGRADPSLIPLYTNYYHYENQITALVKDPKHGSEPKPQVKGVMGMRGVITSFLGGKTDDLIDFEEVSNLGDDVVCLVQLGDDVIVESKDRGAPIAVCYVYGQSKEELMSRYFAICRKVLKKPECSPLA